MAVGFIRSVPRQVAISTKSEGRLTQDSASVLVDYLRWHGVRASVFTGQKNNNSTPHAVLAAASKFHANLLVMGAYTHSRLRETIFGGVTLHVAAEATVPVWMTH
jgi:nucleotide-binding universal stress UspA family protein